MPPRGSYKQTAAASGVLPKSDQRRARNRLAQRAIRERKNAHIQHLEQQLALTQQGDGDSRIQALLEENDKLRRAFLTVRKKLLSLSTTSSLLADSILPFVNAGTASPNQQPVGEMNSLYDSEGSSPAEVMRSEEQRLMTNISSSQCELILDPIDPSVLLQTSQDYGAAPLGESGTRIQPHMLDTDAMGIGKSIVPCDSRTVGGPYAEGLDISANLYFPLGHMPTGFPVNIPKLPNSPLRRTSRLSEHIDFIRYTIRASGWANSFSESPPTILYPMLQECLEQCWPAMVPWFQVTNTSHIMCSVLWWQITNAEAVAHQLLKIYSPTAVQLSVPHPSILDWVPHSALRDHFILNQDSIDLDEVICDLAAAYVVEFEPHDEPHAPKTTLNLMDAVLESLRSGVPLLNSNADYGSEQSMHSGREASGTRRALPVSANIHEFKIDSSFFAKYPALYDPSAVANGIADAPVVMGAVQPPLQLTHHSVQAYMRTARRFATSH